MALRWIREHSREGVCVSDKNISHYPEVTGYFIPTLLEWGEHDLARQYAAWLCKVQDKGGSWSDPSEGIPYSFDTGQVLKGLRAIHQRMPEVGDHIIAGEQFMQRCIRADGRLSTPKDACWNADMTDAIQIYASDDPRVWEYHRKHSQKPALSHFAMYVAEALVDKGQPIPEEKYWPIRLNGMVPGRAGALWSCIPGQFQYALMRYKQGRYITGDSAYQFGLRYQDKNGGFPGCTAGGDYFPDEQPSWAVKFFLDATLWRMKNLFPSHATPTISQDDGRLVALKKALPKDCGRVLDAGCGTGRYLLNIDARKKIGMDLSPWLVRECPYAVEGSLLNIPFPDNYFDCTYAVESLEHSIRPDVAISEMCRVTKPGGTVMIIDKNREHLGEMEIAPWEVWFDIAAVCKHLDHYCEGVTYQFVGWEHNKPTGLFVLWSGVKR